MSPQLALRVTVVGGIALVLFMLLFFRLWSLQVLNSTEYSKAATANNHRTILVEAPRGEILGLNGAPLVESASVPAVSISPSELPVQVTLGTISSATTYSHGPKSGTPKYLVGQPAKDTVIYRRLAKILGMSNRLGNCTVTVYYTGKYVIFSHKRGNAPLMTPIECLVAKGVAESQYANVAIKTGVNADIRDYIDENQTSFEGVIAGDAYRRKYLLADAGAQLFGYTSPITETEFGTKHFAGVSRSDMVGQAGLEYQYNQYLQGSDGYQKVKVNSAGEFEGYGKSYAGQQGNNLKTSIDPALETVGQESLAQSISIWGPQSGADGGAFVAMDPQNGQIYAMGSNPTYNANEIADGISDKVWKYLENPNNHDPLLDNAIQGQGPDGSTFKVITSTAALQSKIWSPTETWEDPGYYCIAGATFNTVNEDNGSCRHNSSGDAGGSFNLEAALEESDDDFFFHLGDLLYHPYGGALQKWEHLYGVGRRTGVDLPDEAYGTLAGPSFVKALNAQQVKCKKHEYPYRHHKGACSIADSDAWTVGDSLNTALGQGDVQVTPLQLAVIYAAVENGGTIVTPHLGEDVQTQSGTVIQKLNFPAKRHLHINPTYLHTIQQGLYYAAHGNYDGKAATSSDVMGNFPLPVYGKTGTAQYGSTAESAAGQGEDYGWYACYVPASATHKPIVVVVWVEKGSFGDESAAPVARQILSQWFYGKPGAYDQGTSTDT